MSIIYNYLAVPSSVIKRAQSDEDFAHTILYREEEEAAKLLPAGCERTDAGKAWDGIAYVLSEGRRRTDDLYEPTDLFGRAVDGFRVLSYDVDNGPAAGSPRFLSVKEVPPVAAALRSITEQVLAVHFDPPAMRKADVYPGDWAVVGFDYLRANFEKLREFYLRAAEKQLAVLVWRS